MIGKIKKGKSFGGCIRYVMGKDNAEIIDSDGVLLGNIREITDSFNYQRELNPKIKQPVGHIALSFKPEDKTLLTDEFMAKIAQEYMELMGIQNTQFILVRHHNTDNPHCHLVYNRIGYDGKVISSQGDYKRNEIATKLLKDKYGLTYAEDKGKTNVKKLHTSERVKYEIFNAVKAALKHSKTWKEFNDYLIRRDIRLEFVKRTRERGLQIPEDISVAGYDGIQSARQLEPRLTTVQQDTEQIGCLAARELISLIERPKTTIIEQVIVPGKVVEGKSVAQIPTDK